MQSESSGTCHCPLFAFPHSRGAVCIGTGIPAPNRLGLILQERGNRYGPFATHAEISQDIKCAIFKCKARKELSADKVEALEMIAHKIARIINGDPEYVDSWEDIAGYATLVVNDLKKKEGGDGNIAKTPQ